MKKIIKLTESDLHKIIKESVKRVLKETDYSTPTGGFNEYAYDYDQALKNAESLEDWDRMMAERDAEVDRGARNAAFRHPSRIEPNGSVGASKYVHPEDYGLNDDDVLSDIEKSNDYGRKYYGFPT